MVIALAELTHWARRCHSIWLPIWIALILSESRYDTLIPSVFSGILVRGKTRSFWVMPFHLSAPLSTAGAHISSVKELYRFWIKLFRKFGNDGKNVINHTYPTIASKLRTIVITYSHECLGRLEEARIFLLSFEKRMCRYIYSTLSTVARTVALWICVCAPSSKAKGITHMDTILYDKFESITYNTSIPYIHVETHFFILFCPLSKPASARGFSRRLFMM